MKVPYNRDMPGGKEMVEELFGPMAYFSREIQEMERKEHQNKD
jgi:hypothetical protein